MKWIITKKRENARKLWLLSENGPKTKPSISGDTDKAGL